MSLKELLEEMEAEGGITVECPNCYAPHFIEPDAEIDCYECDCTIPNPLIKAGVI